MEQNDSVMNKFINNLPVELHLYDPLVGHYSACGPGTRTADRIKKICWDWWYKSVIKKWAR